MKKKNYGNMEFLLIKIFATIQVLEVVNETNLCNEKFIKKVLPFTSGVCLLKNVRFSMN